MPHIRRPLSLPLLREFLHHVAFPMGGHNRVLILRGLRASPLGVVNSYTTFGVADVSKSPLFYHHIHLSIFFSILQIAATSTSKMTNSLDKVSSVQMKEHRAQQADNELQKELHNCIPHDRREEALKEDRHVPDADALDHV